MELQDVHVIFGYWHEVWGVLPIILLVPPKILRNEIAFSQGVFKDGSYIVLFESEMLVSGSMAVDVKPQNSYIAIDGFP